MNRNTVIGVGIAAGGVIVAVMIVVVVVEMNAQEREQRAEFFASRCPDATTNEECNAAMSAREEADRNARQKAAATPWRTPQAVADDNARIAASARATATMAPVATAANQPLAGWEQETVTCLVAARKAIAAMSRCGLKFNYENPSDPMNLCLVGTTADQLLVLASSTCPELRAGCDANPGLCQP